MRGIPYPDLFDVLVERDALAQDAEYRDLSAASQFRVVGRPRRGLVGNPGGSRTYTPDGSVAGTGFRFTGEPGPLTTGNVLRNRATGERYRVNWALQRDAPRSLAHVEAGVSIYQQEQ